jgi:hypothetical protein
LRKNNPQVYIRTNDVGGDMQLKEYLKSQVKKLFAKKLGITARALANYADGKRETPLGVALEIERLTHRKVTVEDLEFAYWKEDTFMKAFPKNKKNEYNPQIALKEKNET